MKLFVILTLIPYFANSQTWQFGVEEDIFDGNSYYAKITGKHYPYNPSFSIDFDSQNLYPEFYLYNTSYISDVEYVHVVIDDIYNSKSYVAADLKGGNGVNFDFDSHEDFFMALKKGNKLSFRIVCKHLQSTDLRFSLKGSSSAIKFIEENIEKLKEKH